MAAVKGNPDYVSLTTAEREDLYERYKETAERERMLKTRGTLGIPQATINLNTCAEDAMESIPKLNKVLRKRIINKRNNLPNQRFTSWDELATINGIGETIMDQLKVFCIDPATSPAPPQHPTLMMSTREKAAQEEHIFHQQDQSRIGIRLSTDMNLQAQTY